MSNTLERSKRNLTSLRNGVDDAIDFINECQKVLRAVVSSPSEDVEVNTGKRNGSFIRVTIEAYYDDPGEVPPEAYDFPGDSSFSLSEDGGRYKLRLHERFEY